MVTPGRSWEVNSFGVRVVTSQESSCDTKRSGTGQRLSNGNLSKELYESVTENTQVNSKSKKANSHVPLEEV